MTSLLTKNNSRGLWKRNQCFSIWIGKAGLCFRLITLGLSYNNKKLNTMMFKLAQVCVNGKPPSRRELDNLDHVGRFVGEKCVKFSPKESEGASLANNFSKCEASGRKYFYIKNTAHLSPSVLRASHGLNNCPRLPVSEKKARNQNRDCHNRSKIGAWA